MFGSMDLTVASSWLVMAEGSPAVYFTPLRVVLFLRRKWKKRHARLNGPAHRFLSCFPTRNSFLRCRIARELSCGGRSQPLCPLQPVQRRPGDGAKYPGIQLRVFFADRPAFPVELRLPVQESSLFRGRCGERQVSSHVGDSPEMRETAR